MVFTNKLILKKKEVDKICFFDFIGGIKEKLQERKEQVKILKKEEKDKENKEPIVMAT